VIPRVVVAGTSSGAGKTTIACGLIGALRARGLTVQGFKVGPDFIDTSHHALASGRPGRNLDAFLSGPELIAPLARHGAAGADVAVIEGVMGLFDGASGRGELASTAHVAKLLDAPVLLVLDASAMARSAAAIVHGFRSFDTDVRIAGVILNRVGSDHHEQLLREAIEPLGVPVLGALRRDERVATPERHLGLVPAGEREPRARAALDVLATTLAERTDLDAILALARSAPSLEGPAWSAGPADESEAGGGLSPSEAGAGAHEPNAPLTSRARIAIARGPAFSFHYEENLELLRATGAELLPFDPLRDAALPDGANGLLLAGGFPEVYGAELAANAELRAQVAALAARGAPVLAECGGLLYLCERLDEHEMCGVLPARAHMGERLAALGYREATAQAATPWLAAGERVRGHEFHYARVEPASGAEASGAERRAPGGADADRAPAAAWTLAARGVERAEGFVAGGVQASFLHVHWAAFPHVAHAFARAAAAHQANRAVSA
jgi:cobyrinic acid a,c-diamide synthase